MGDGGVSKYFMLVDNSLRRAKLPTTALKLTAPLAAVLESSLASVDPFRDTESQIHANKLAEE